MTSCAESAVGREAGAGGGLHHAEHQTGPQAGPRQRQDARRLLGTVCQTARRHEVSRPTATLRQGQHPTYRHAENPTKVRPILITFSASNINYPIQGQLSLLFLQDR